ncbi:MAG: hypothetical protein E7K46_06270 [Corynebacterium sp.]|nr:hypothetical protein [Corynebacterium sp.]
METAYVLDWDIINAYAASLIPAYAPGTPQRRRTRLRAMARIVNPSYVNPHALDSSEPDSTPSAVYASRDQADQGLDELCGQFCDQHIEQAAGGLSVPCRGPEGK